MTRHRRPPSSLFFLVMSLMSACFAEPGEQANPGNDEIEPRDIEDFAE